jgi:hypothetical protein
MTNDIVTQLRVENYPLLQFGNHQDWCTALGIMDEAADEIERLRAELVRVLKPKDIWHDCSHCMGHEPSDNA